MKKLQKPAIILISVLLIASLCGNVYLAMLLNTANATVSANAAQQATYEMKLSEQQKTIDELTAKIMELENRIISLTDENTTLKAENDLLKKENSELKATPNIGTPVKKPNIGTPVKQEKPASTAKPNTSSKPATEKPKPSTPAPTYTNVWEITYVCNGAEFKPDCLPPTDGNRWCWGIDPAGWFWDADTPDTAKSGWDGDIFDSATDNGGPDIPNMIR